MLAFALQLVSTTVAQQPAKTAAKSTASNDIFSGNVTAASSDSVTVVRRLPARADEYKVFVIDQGTKTEGKLRVNARVSVQFKASDDGSVHAMRIIVRADAKPAGKTQSSTTTK